MQRLTGLDHLVTEFSFGGMPHEQAEQNMRLFARDVMPVLQRDAAFQGVVEPAPLPGAVQAAHEDVFAPA